MSLSLDFWLILGRVFDRTSLDYAGCELVGTSDARAYRLADIPREWAMIGQVNGVLNAKPDATTCSKGSEGCG